MASDFGSSASIYRTDGKPPQPADEERIAALGDEYRVESSSGAW
jgi:hypothetical protein